MRLRVKNVGILGDSEIEIAGITVVAGENNTGKSTFGKALYSVFSVLSHLDRRVEQVRRTGAVSVALSTFSSVNNLSSEEWLHSVTGKLRRNRLTADLIQEVVDSCPEDLLDGREEFVKRATDILTMDEATVQERLILNSFTGEFGSQVQNQLHRDEESIVNLVIKDKTISVVIRNEAIASTSGIRNLDHVPVYLDQLSPNLTSDKYRYVSRWMFDSQHNANLYDLIGKSLVNDDNDGDSTVIQDILNDQMLKPVQDRLKEICHGSLRSVGKGIKFVDENMPGVSLDLKNVSAGLKTFLILQELIRNGSIGENGTVILDEPEIHLHPQWQVVLAEMIVLLQKAMGLHVLITSHSPYFISAIDVFAKKHDVIKNNRYYFSSREGNSVFVEDVTDRIRIIYDSLAAPYQTIQDEATKVEE